MATHKDTYDLVKKVLADKDLPQKLLVLSPDRVRRERLCSMLLQRVPAECRRKVSGAELAPKEARLLCESFSALSLFSATQLILIQEADKLCAESSKLIAQALKTLPPATHLIVTGSKLTASDPLYKLMAKDKALIAFSELEGSELVRWIEKELKQCGITKWEDALVHTIIEVADSSPDSAAAMVQHLALALEGDSATLKDFFSVFESRVDANEFALIDTLNSGHAAAAEEQLINILRSGKPALLLLNLLARNFSTYLKIAALQEQGLNPVQIRQKLALQPWLYEKHQKALRRYSKAKLKQILKAVLKADSRLKNISLGNDIVMGSLLERIAA